MHSVEVSESTEAIRERILRDAREKADRIIKEARNRAEEIIRKAKKNVEETKKIELKQRKEHIDQTSRERLAEEKIERHRRLQSFRSEMIEKVYDEALNRLRNYCEKPQYVETLKKLAVEAGIALRGGDLLILANERDQKRLTRKILDELSTSIERKTNKRTILNLAHKTINCIGGVVVSTVDERATVDNTLDARLKRLKEEIRTELEAILFR